MATQSLYRRFRPRKFSELYGQEHVVRALRNAVANGREGQAYLFSGPRGTGKTTTARILAKVLNCEKPVDGEPCCSCDSCMAVEAGTSYDVLELDAASNNGVGEIREIIESAALTSPGRHRVFILDEVHMLSANAEAALLKTLEEPPAQVVFVLATTNPQKVSETIRSRVQHFQFHLLPLDELEKYVRHVVESAGLDVTEEAIESVLRQGGGSARDTLSALELVAAGGGTPADDSGVDDLARALVARDHAAALAVVARVMQQGRDARTFADDAVRMMRDCFLSLMSPELVQAPDRRREELRAMARELGAQRIVKVMETLGTTMVEMRHAPDARLLLEVAIVRLASPVFDDSMDNVLARLNQLEEAVKSLRESGPGVVVPSAPTNPATGRAVVGGLATTGADTAGAVRPAPSPTTLKSETLAESGAVAPSPPPESVATPTPSQSAAPQGADPAQMWSQIVESMKGMPKALFKPAMVDSVSGNTVTLRLPSNTPMARVKDHTKTLVEAIAGVCGGKWTVDYTVADPTAPGGISRPKLPPTNIAEEVANDPDAPVDLGETVDASDADDPMMEVLKKNFPEGFVEEQPSSPAPTASRSSAGSSPRTRK